MAYTLTAPASLGVTGLTLKVSFVNTAGTLHATLRNLAATELGTTGIYTFTSAAVDDGYRGQMIWHTGTATTSAFAGCTVYAVAGVNPEELELTNADLSDIKAKTDLISAGDFDAVSPVSADGATLNLFRGDDYFNADSRALSWSNSDWNLSGGGVSLKIGSGNTTELTITGTISSATACRFDMTRTQSAALTNNTYTFEVEFTSSGDHVQTLVVGTCNMGGQL